ncbi:hypothetical protein [Methylobacterium sp. WL116]|uniref:hypothetical protein n=1 Tax=Methylobacterium sp. WL116 TaxID=2603889 RepID=UPI0011CB9A59|nr:hypothetical protein [Methylobacterium sp. WL116]TXM91871.1 hypothetical protein FV223_13710 [Methylobacterium sp. WL116]
MFFLRYTLIAISGLLLLIMLAFWTISGRLTDIVSLIVFLYLGSNLFYLIFSHPTFKASGFFQRAATGLAFASLELRHQANEAEIREIEAERIRNLDNGSKAYKLRAATEFLQYIRDNPTIKKYYALESQQEAAKPQENIAIAALPNDQRAIASPQSSVALAPGPANPQLPIRTQSLPSKRLDTAVQTNTSIPSPPVMGSQRPPQTSNP